MLIKCAKSASLRAAFPEDVTGYTVDEMEDREVETGGVTIDGKIDHGDPGLTDRDRQADQAYPPPPPGEATDPLDEPNGTRWLQNLLALLARCSSEDEVVQLRGDARVHRALDDKKMPKLIRDQIADEFTKTFERVRAERDEAAEASIEDPGPPGDDAGHDWPDRMAELIAEVEAMDLVALNGLKTSAAWRKRVRDATEIPPDEDRLNDAIAARKAALQGRS
jgi:hypothetical protein